MIVYIVACTVSNSVSVLVLVQIKVEKPPPEDYELRMILWRAEKMKSMDEVSTLLCLTDALTDGLID